MSSSPDFSRIFLDDHPLIDVRAPVEFADGHFPRSVSLPLMTDEERHQVGIEYKERGQAAAIELGHRLVGGPVKAERVERWREFARANPGTRMYCARGGLRSQISSQWLREAGTPVEIVPGGYKELRRFLIDRTAEIAARHPIWIIGGRTGSGKTTFLQSLASRFSVVDLERIARHKGSAFGAMGPLGTQPSQATFENAVAIELLRAVDSRPRSPLVFEDESRSIGALQLPLPLFEAMQAAPVVVLERPWDERVAAIVREYVVEKTEAMGGDPLLVRDFLLAALDRIVKKLGGKEHARIRAQLLEAFAGEAPSLGVDRHRDWVESLLRSYYDPLYDRSTVKQKDRIRFRGNAQECRDYLAASLGSQA